MTSCPLAVWDPLGPQTAYPMSRHDIVCLHTMAGPFDVVDRMFHDGGYRGTESHFGVRGDGFAKQWQDLDFRADANNEGNHRVISIETADMGEHFPPWGGSDVPAWTDAQIDKIVKLVAWCCDRYGIPKQLVPDSKPGRRGIAYHRQGIPGDFPPPYTGWVPGGELWTVLPGGRGKPCVPTDNTDILTLRGWVPLREVTPDDRVASWSMDSGAVSFERAVVLEPFTAEVFDIGGFESTADHQWVVPDEQGGWKKLAAAGLSRFVEVPSAVETNLDGLGYSDAEVALLVWAQGDGHFMRDGRHGDGTPYGVEWHLAKTRKIERLTQVLTEAGLEFTRGDRSNGTVSLRTYGPEARRLIVDRLPGKDFGSDLLAMSPREATAFLGEVTGVDGSTELDCYFSKSAQSADIVQAIATLHGRVTSHRVDRRGLHWVRFLKRPRRIRGPMPTRVTEVSCLTTVDGTLIIRQHGRVAVTGNCPGDRRIRQLIEIVIPRVNGDDDMAWTQEDWDRMSRLVDGRIAAAEDRVAARVLREFNEQAFSKDGSPFRVESLRLNRRGVNEALDAAPGDDARGLLADRLASFEDGVDTELAAIKALITPAEPTAG